MLFGMVIVNSLVAFASWWLAAGVIFPDLGDAQKAAGAAIGALLIGSIDWFVVAPPPRFPGWFTTGAPSLASLASVSSSAAGW